MTKDQNSDDIEFTENTESDIELEEVETNSKAKIQKLQKKLKACEKEKLEHLESLQRSKADFLNSKRRLETAREEDKERLIEDHISKLLPLYDSFQMAMGNTVAWESVDENWRKGVEGIFNQLKSVLTAYGVREVCPEGEAFDPAQHEAVANEPVTDENMHHKITSVHQIGFIRVTHGKEQLVRPARVTVGEFSN